MLFEKLARRAAGAFGRGVFRYGLLERVRTILASVVAIGLGVLFFGLGLWVLILQAQGLYAYGRPSGLTIGQVTVDGKEAKEHSEIFRARYDHHFHVHASIPSATGFLDVVTLDSQLLFHPVAPATPAQNMKVEVSGVDLGSLVKYVNQLAKPPEWLLDADFQNRPDRALAVLRLRRGAEVVRTWYLERPKGPPEQAPVIIERLIDDAIFRLAFDFWTAPETDGDLRKWRDVIARPKSRSGQAIPFPSAAAVGAWYTACAGLGRYYSQGDWKDLDLALEALRTLRVEMPDFEDGLQLLAIALAERREEGEAIHVHEQLAALLDKRAEARKDDAALARRRWEIVLLKASAKTRLYTWQSAHEAVRELDRLHDELKAAGAGLDELTAHTEIQLAYAYALYLDYIRYTTITEVFARRHFPDSEKWRPLRNSDEDVAELAAESTRSRPVVLRRVTEIAKRHIQLLREAQGRLEKKIDWKEVGDKRRRDELEARLMLARGYGRIRMAEWERGADDPAEKKVWKWENPEDRSDPDLLALEGETFETLLQKAKDDLRVADARHPNHYQVLQLIGLAFSEPRDERADLSVAEQYLERAIRSNPYDHGGHEMLATLLLRRVANRGVDWASKDTIVRGLSEAQAAIALRDISFIAHLRRAEFQAMLLALETDPARRPPLRAQLEQYRDQARRFTPRAFQQEDPDLAWVGVVATQRQLAEEEEALASPTGDAAQHKQRLRAARAELEQKLVALIGDGEHDSGSWWWLNHWVPNQRTFEIALVKKRAQELLDRMGGKQGRESWRNVPIAFR